MTCRILGHPAEWIWERDEWIWADTGEIVNTASIRARRCTLCDTHPTPDGHDACIANLPGVRNACCGHGHTEDAYVQFDATPPYVPAPTIRYETALQYFLDRCRGPNISLSEAA